MEGQVTAARTAADAATAAAIDMTRTAAIQPPPEGRDPPVPRPSPGPARDLAAAAEVNGSDGPAETPAAALPDVSDEETAVTERRNGGIGMPAPPTDPLVTAAIAPNDPLPPALDDEEETLSLLPPGLAPDEDDVAATGKRTFVMLGNRIIPLPARSRPAIEAERSAFGLDIGGAPSREAAKALWDYLKGGEAEFLAGLQPLARTGDGEEVRLILGPYADAADAAGACARLSRGGTACTTTLYAGESLP
jgi:hypothetical protein